MNISQPIASYIGSVDFGFLSSAEIEALSVKKIRNPTTFDDLLNPVPNGLYDSALGAWADNACSTCHLLSYACPGHVGHIELPVPVYHVTFIDQLLRLLRARCAYCSRLKMSRDEINRYVCKLRLIQYGLLDEAKELDNMSLENFKLRKKVSRSDRSDEEVDEDVDSLRQRRDDFVKLAIKNAGGTSHKAKVAAQKVEALSDERRAVMKEFFKHAPNVRACGSCYGLSHSYRRDGFVKIFQKPLGEKDRAKMVQGGFNVVNPLIKVLSERKAMQNQRREDRDVDEGIVADLEDTSADESGEDIEMLEIVTDMVPSNAKGSRRKTRKSTENEGNLELYMNAQEVHAAISDLMEKDGEILSLIYNPRGAKNKSKPIVTADMFFIKNLLVPPNKFRPEIRTGAGEITEAVENSHYKQIMSRCITMNQIRAELDGSLLEPTAQRRDFRDLQNAWIQLQHSVNNLIDSSRRSFQGAATHRIEDGIRQKLEKKEGLFRKNMMGKRVNFAARSVISPDPNIETNEIGVPPVFAKKLTYPEPVTNHNFYELKEAVLNGVEKWPGAAAIESENGQVINLRTKNFEERQALANQLLAPSNTNVNGARNKKVHRHLNNGDIVLMNRQPTLHKPSIMAHRARVLPGEKTIRMHYTNCNTYNADFDGDEMNMHFPQNEVARAEALQIADTDHQYLVATSGKPLRGLIQDHISMGVWLTNRDILFDREDYYQLLYSCLRPENNHTISEKIQTVTPAVLKPSLMWTGKQVVTTVLKNITPETHPGLSLIGKSQISGDSWGDNYGEDVVIFQNGELLCGILDKAHLGPSKGGFVHSIYEAYGHTIAGRLLSILGRLLTKLLHMRAFSCGMEDLLLTETGESNRREKLQEAKTIGLEVAAKYVTLELNPLAPATELLRTRLQDVLLDDEKQAGLDIVFNSRTSDLSSEITKVCLPRELRKPFPRNQMQAMTTSGAKGTAVNANFISCNLGQQVLEGRRVPVMVSGKTLPSFKPFDTDARAGGYITDRFLTGVKPQEYFFHAMAGREGLIDTAVKTSSSGYLQRCLIKGMEGLRVEYDSSVRDSDGTMIQFLYGEDALDVTKQTQLKNFKFLAENYMSLAAQLDIRDKFSKISDTGARAHRKAAMKKVKKSGRVDAMDPTLALFNPGSNIGSTSEYFAEALTAYCRTNPDRLIKDKEKAPNAHVSKKTFSALLEMKYMKSVVDPGEAVGIIAGQSIGEPSTQMTLNTFHLAGHSAKNVTLGIPRLREIVMTASKNMSTPSMTLHLIPELSEEAGKKFAKGITKVTLAEVMEKLSIAESVGKGTGSERAKIYDIRLDLFPSKEYQETYGIEVADVLNTIEYKFIPQLITAIKKELRQKVNAGPGASAAQPDVGRSSGKIQDVSSCTETNGEGGLDEDDDGDADATNTKQKRNRDEAISYEAPDEEEIRIAKQDRRQSSPDAVVDDEGFSGSPRQSQHEDEANEDGGDVEKGSITRVKRREGPIKERHEQVSRFSFDAEGGSWCKIELEYNVFTSKLLILNLAESACHTAVIQSIPNLGACTFTKEKTRDPVTGDEITLPIVVTSGVNLRAMHAYQSILNPHKIFTNDIHAMLAMYGVEACRATIMREMDAVFKGHSISVDNRHLNLIADFMTKGGAFAPFSRTGLKGAVSPFFKMSFETTVAFLSDAVLDGDWDDLRGPSSRIVVGRVGRVGTGAFDVLMPVN